MSVPLPKAQSKQYINDNQEFLQFLKTRVTFCAWQNLNKKW